MPHRQNSDYLHRLLQSGLATKARYGAARLSISIVERGLQNCPHRFEVFNVVVEGSTYGGTNHIRQPLSLLRKLLR
jgi:hypothetical protein